MQTLHSYVAAAQLADRRAFASTRRAARQATSVAAAPAQDAVLRRATHHDDAALARLADLDSAPRPIGEMLLAEVDEEIIAAVPFDGGRAIADPFRPTSALVEQLRVRASQLADGRTPPPRRPQRLHPPLPFTRIFA